MDEGSHRRAPETPASCPSGAGCAGRRHRSVEAPLGQGGGQREPEGRAPVPLGRGRSPSLGGCRRGRPQRPLPADPRRQPGAVLLGGLGVSGTPLLLHPHCGPHRHTPVCLHAGRAQGCLRACPGPLGGAPKNRGNPASPGRVEESPGSCTEGSGGFPAPPPPLPVQSGRRLGTKLRDPARCLGPTVRVQRTPAVPEGTGQERFPSRPFAAIEKHVRFLLTLGRQNEATPQSWGSEGRAVGVFEGRAGGRRDARAAGGSHRRTRGGGQGRRGGLSLHPLCRASKLAVSPPPAPAPTSRHGQGEQGRAMGTADIWTGTGSEPEAAWGGGRSPRG